MANEYMKWDLEKLQDRYLNKMKDNSKLQKEIYELGECRRKEMCDQIECNDILKGDIKILENKCAFKNSKIIKLHVNHDYIECVQSWEYRSCYDCHLFKDDECKADRGTTVKVITCLDFKHDKLKGKYGKLDYVDMDFENVTLNMVNDLNII